MKSGVIAGSFVTWLAAALLAGTAHADDDGKDLAARARSGISETRGYVTRLDAELRGWNSDLARDRETAEADAAKWGAEAAQQADPEKKKRAGQYRGGYESHAHALKAIQDAANDLGKLVEALGQDQVLLESLQDQIEKGTLGGDRAPYAQSLEGASKAVRKQNLQAQLLLQLLQRIGSATEREDSQLRGLVAAMSGPDPAMQWRREVLETGVAANTLELKHIKVGTNLVELVQLLLKRSAGTLAMQVDEVKAMRR